MTGRARVNRVAEEMELRWAERELLASLRRHHYLDDALRMIRRYEEAVREHERMAAR